MRNLVLVATMMIAGFAFAGGHKVMEKWHSNSPPMLLKVFSDRSAEIRKMCGSIDVPAGAWNENGGMMRAMHFPGHPMARRIPVVISATKRDGALYLKDQTEDQSYKFTPGAGPGFPTCK